MIYINPRLPRIGSEEVKQRHDGKFVTYRYMEDPNFSQEELTHIKTLRGFTPSRWVATKVTDYKPR
jgi:hypothetical protein